MRDFDNEMYDLLELCVEDRCLQTRIRRALSNQHDVYTIADFAKLDLNKLGSTKLVGRMSREAIIRMHAIVMAGKHGETQRIEQIQSDILRLSPDAQKKLAAWIYSISRPATSPKKLPTWI